MQKHGLMPAAVILMATLVAGCSDDSDSGSTITTLDINVQVNQEDIQFGLVRSQLITDAGLPSADFELQPIVASVEANNEGLVTIPIPETDIHQFQLTGREADDSRGATGTTRTCQWVEGCVNNVAFGATYPVTTGMDWRTVAFGLQDNELVRLTPLTELAAELGIQLVYNETFQGDSNLGIPDQQNVWTETGFYSPNSVVQSVSQVSRLFDIDDIQTREPADLTQINEWATVNTGAALYSIRYGAILAAWQKLSQDYVAANPAAGTFAQAVAADLVANDGQLLQSGSSQTTSLAQIYTLAADNLKKIEGVNAEVTAFISSVVNSLEAEVAELNNNSEQLTDIRPEALSNLLGQSTLNDIELGIERSKAFLELLLPGNGDTGFFEEGYQERIVAYRDELRQIGTDQQDNFNTIVQSFVLTRQLYIECLLANGACPTHEGEAGWEWLQSASFSNNVLTINDGAIVVSQAVADVNPSDADDNPTQSQGIDLLIKGTYQHNELTFVVDHTYTDEDERDEILIPAGIRIFYPQAVSEIQDPEVMEEIAYEIRWADFTFSVNEGQSDEFELEGAFSQFYRGVLNPDLDADDSSNERRFNIETITLRGRISDQIGDDDANDDDITTLSVSARSLNADTFYPELKFASFNGFLSERTNPAHPDGSVENDLVMYRFGQEQLQVQIADYFDFIVPLGESVRYRFLPTRSVEDDTDLDEDGDRDDFVITHDFERCTLEKNQQGEWLVDRCDGRQRLLGERDIQQSLNDLWEVGVLSRVTIDNRGTYFVEWPAVQNPDNQQCLILDEVSGSNSMSGTLYAPVVLGLNSLRFTTEISLDDNDDNTSDPRTLLDASLLLSTPDEYQVNAALSHDYSAIDSSSGLNLGTGDGLDRVLISYDTRGDIADSGSVTIFKDGVSLTLDDGTEETVDSTLVASVRQLSSAMPLPYKFVSDREGNFDRCVLRNEAEFNDVSTLEDAIIPINFRGVVYGQIRQENGVWVARFVNGEFITVGG